VVLGVSLLASIALLAGAGSAQATNNTTICTTSNLPGLVCPAADRRPAFQLYEARASGTNAIINSAGEFLSCTGSTLDFESLAQVGSSSTLPAKVTSWSLSGCRDVTSNLSCSTSFFGPVPPYNMSIQWTGSDHGSLKVTDPFGHSLLLKYSCGPVNATVSCVFEAPEIELETSSLTPAIANMSVFMTFSGGSSSCGEFSKMAGSFTFTYPSPDTFFVEHD
jgi:hypothetical protein